METNIYRLLKAVIACKCTKKNLLKERLTWLKDDKSLAVRYPDITGNQAKEEKYGIF